MNEKELEQAKEVVDMLYTVAGGHLAQIIGSGISQATPDQRCMERLLWGNVYGHVIQAALGNSNVDGTPAQLSMDAILYANLAVGAYNARFPNAKE